MRQSVATRRGSKRELLRIDGRAVEVTMRLNPRARRLIVKVHPSTGEVTVVAPSQRALDRALDFARGETPGLRASLRACRSRSRSRRARAFRFGRRAPDSDGRSAATVRSGRMKTATIRVSGRDEHAPRRVLDFLKREARKTLEARSLEYADAHRRTKPRASRCATRPAAGAPARSSRSISFSWRLILAPAFVLDYVVAHEVAHLREMNHGPRFWRLVRTLGAGYRCAAGLAAEERRRAAPLCGAQAGLGSAAEQPVDQPFDVVGLVRPVSAGRRCASRR